MKEIKLLNQNEVGCTAKIVPQPINLEFRDQNGIIGQFKEVNGKFTFEGELEESGRIFVDFVLKTFEQRILWLTKTE